MLNKTSINVGKVLGLTGGGIVGAAIAWVIAEVLVYQIYEKEIQYYEETVDDLGYVNETPEEPIVMKKTVSTRNEGEKVVTNYAEQFKRGKLNTRKVDHEEAMDADEEPGEPEEEVNDGRPFVVTEEEWSKDSKYSSVTLTYYADDRVVTDETDKVIKNPETLIGPDALDSFGEGTEDPDTVFVKNVDEETYYEICRTHGSYDEIVLGLPKKESKKVHVKKSKEVVDDEIRDSKKRRAQQKAKLMDDETDDETT